MSPTGQKGGTFRGNALLLPLGCSIVYVPVLIVSLWGALKEGRIKGQVLAG